MLSHRSEKNRNMVLSLTTYAWNTEHSFSKWYIQSPAKRVMQFLCIIEQCSDRTMFRKKPCNFLPGPLPNYARLSFLVTELGSVKSRTKYYQCTYFCACSILPYTVSKSINIFLKLVRSLSVNTNRGPFWTLFDNLLILLSKKYIDPTFQNAPARAQENRSTDLNFVCSCSKRTRTQKN